MEDIVKVEIYSIGTAVLKSKLLVSCISKKDKKIVSHVTGGKWAGSPVLGSHDSYLLFLFPAHKWEGTGGCCRRKENEYWEITSRLLCRHKM